MDINWYLRAKEEFQKLLGQVQITNDFYESEAGFGMYGFAFTMNNVIGQEYIIGNNFRFSALFDNGNHHSFAPQITYNWIQGNHATFHSEDRKSRYNSVKGVERTAEYVVECIVNGKKDLIADVLLCAYLCNHRGKSKFVNINNELINYIYNVLIEEGITIWNSSVKYFLYTNYRKCLENVSNYSPQQFAEMAYDDVLYTFQNKIVDVAFINPYLAEIKMQEYMDFKKIKILTK